MGGIARGHSLSCVLQGHLDITASRGVSAIPLANHYFALSSSSYSGCLRISLDFSRRRRRFISHDFNILQYFITVPFQLFSMPTIQT